MIFILIASLLILILFYFIKSYQKSPPGPYGLPVLGYYPFLGSDPVETLCRLSKEHKDVMSINLFGETFWVLNSHEAIIEALVTKGEIFSARQTTEYSLFKLSAEDTILISEGVEWKKHMKFIIGHLSDLGMGKSKLDITIHSILEEIEKYIYLTDGKPMDYSELLHNYTFNVLTEMMCGKRFKIGDPIIAKIMNWHESIFSSLGYMNMILSGNLFRILMLLKPQYAQNLNKNLEEFNEFTASLVEERKKIFDGEHYLCYIDYWIKESKGPFGDYFKIEKLASEINQLYTSIAVPASFVYQCLYLSALYSNIQRKVFDEIESTIGTDRDIGYLEIYRLPYVKAVIYETLRFIPFIPLGVVHVNTAATKLMGYDVPKRQKVIPNFYALTRDPKNFVNPDEFDPNNFLDKDGNFKPNAASMPFGIGYRKCLGPKLAETLIFIGFVRLIQKFEWSLPIREELNSAIYKDGNVRFIKPYEMIAKRRE